MDIVNINTAGKIELIESLGLSEDVANRIIRMRNGAPFTDLKDLVDNVTGLGYSTIEKSKINIEFSLESTNTSTKLVVFDIHGDKKYVSVNRYNLEELVSELGFNSAEELFNRNFHLLLTFGDKKKTIYSSNETKISRKKPTNTPLSTDDIANALALLLRAIARASGPQLAMVPPPEDEVKEINGHPAIEITPREGCNCPCPDGVNVEFLIEWDAPGPVNPDLFSDTLSRGKTRNPRGQKRGTTIELEGDKTVTLNFGNPALGQLNSGDIIVTFTIKPFFSKGFDEDDCCITARGSFAGNARIVSYTNRNKPNEQIARGRTNINQSISIGDCDIEEGKSPCCTAIYRWNFNQFFSVNALGFDVDTSVRGVITLELKVWES